MPVTVLLFSFDAE